MDAMSVLENSYYVINKNFGFYKRNYGHIYYLNVQDDETKFIDKMFGKVENELSAQDKMLNYSISAIYTATAVLIEILNRNKIEFNEKQIEKICVGFSNMDNSQTSFADKTEEELDEILFGLLTDGIDLESRKKSGSERTPDEIIKYMLDIIGYDETVSYAKTIVDPACGTGTFVKQIIDRFIDGLYVNEVTNTYKEKLLEHKLIRAYDTKPSNVFVTKIVIISSLVKRNLIREMKDVLDMAIKLPVYCRDFLCVGDNSDYIIGNPPYIRLQNMSIEYRKFIKDNFVSATGRFDIFTCFLEKSDKLLNENGRMCLITSNKYLTANYGVGIRKYLSQTGHVRKLVDLYDTKFFGAAVLPAIIMCENSKRDNCEVDYIGIKTAEQDVQYECLNANELFDYVENELTCGKRFVFYGDEDKQVFEVSRSKVKMPADGKTWNFSTSDENTIKIKMDKVLPIDIIDERITDKLIGEKLDISLSTKQRGQQLERMVAYQLGYSGKQDGLEGGYPDIRNQMLEVKVQDSPTIDLGRYSPQFEEQINDNFTTRTIRYLIALTNAMDGAIAGLIMCPGEELGKSFTYVAEKSFKCQRSIPMGFFEEFKGQVVFNP